MNIEARFGLGRILAVLIVAAALSGCNSSGSDFASGAAGAGATVSSPLVSGIPAATVMANAAYSFRPKSVSPAGTSLIFSIQNKPAWASFGSLTGQLTGTPSASDAGEYPNIVIGASDGTSTATLPGFSIKVLPTTSSGTASASSSSSGAVSSSGGTTAGASSSSSGGGTTAGTSSSSSSGGTVAGTSSSSSSSSGAAPVSSTTSITLSWVAPTENTDGSALTNLAGYDIYYGTSATAMTQKIAINTVGMLTYVISNLTSGTWYFEVVAVNSTGVESGPSSTVSTSI